MATEADIKTLKLKIQTLGNRIRAITEQGRLIDNDSSQLFLFKGMYKELRPYFTTFREHWDNLTDLCLALKKEFPAKEEKTMSTTMERLYYEAHAIYEHYMNPTPVKTDPTVTAGSISNQSGWAKSRLPPIDLPKYDGSSSSKWPLFRDTFRSLIHEEDNLSKIEKFHFLISSLQGEALSLIKGIPIQEDTYDQAYDLVQTTYNNKRLLATNYLKTLLDFKPMTFKPNSKALRSFLGTVIENIASLKLLNIPKLDEFILFTLTVRCLDPSTRKAFERINIDTEYPQYESLVTFLKNECKALELATSDVFTYTGHSTRPNFSSQSASRFKYNQNQSFRTKSQKSSFFVDSDKSNFRQKETDGNTSRNISRQSTTPVSSDKRPPNSQICPVCSHKHSLYQCVLFKGLPPADKRKALKDWVGCFNCLSSFHKTGECPSIRTCKHCKKGHHSWLHESDNQSQPSTSSCLTPTSGIVGDTRIGNISHADFSGIATCGEVLLGTALAHVKDAHGKYKVVRMVLDCGSQCSFMTQACAARLGLPLHPTNRSISGVGQTQLIGMQGQLTCSMKPCDSSHPELITEAIVVNKITNELPHIALTSKLSHSCNSYKLADPDFWKPGPIDFLAGADIYFDIVSGAAISVTPQFPKHLPTIFGYVVVGRTKGLKEYHYSSSLLTAENTELSHMISKFWELEEVNIPRPIVSSEDQYCEEHFVNTHYRLLNGRYVVALPFRNSNQDFPLSRNQAIIRFINLEKKLERDPSLKLEYHSFMRDYINLRHMSVTREPSVYVIPHHCVFKQEGAKTKLRVVFDASSRTFQGSLNDHLYKGPKLQKDIGLIILNFRLHLVVLTADIVKMFRQIIIRPEDRKYQRIVWRFDVSEPIEVYELHTVTYGLVPSPFQANRVIVQLVHDDGHLYPRAAAVLENDIYIDDIATGAPSVEEAKCLQRQLVALLSRGQFELSKWASNRPELIENIDDSSKQAACSLGTSDDSSIKILGLQWHPQKDVFSYKIETPSSNMTKRSILSAIARIYDPLGYLSPVTFYAKSILQETWLSKVGWDETVPPQIASKWTVFIKEMPELSNVSITRYLSSQDADRIELLGFCDASQKGYCAAAYLRVVNSGNVSVHLLKAKTKVAPTKPTSIPRLELCGALLLSRLLKSIEGFTARLNIQDLFCFTDSTVVLSWLSTSPDLLKTFVAHRVVEISDNIKTSSWFHIRSGDNPADCGSRGLSPSELVSHTLWWSGPQWLRENPAQWQITSASALRGQSVPEMKRHQEALIAIESDNTMEVFIQWMTNISSYLTVLRGMAYAWRFYTLLKTKRREYSGAITHSELIRSNRIIIRCVQRYYFKDCFTPTGELSSSKRLLALNPFLDSYGLIRVGGRLNNSYLPPEIKHPIILPYKSHLSALIVDYYHKSYMHLGPVPLQAMITNKYWICSARNLIKQRVNRCLTCFRATQRPQPPLMGNLPASRFAEGKAFQHVGVDLAGPFMIKESLRRNASCSKAYLCLFICMSTKAVHLETVSSCSTDAFLAALDRFVARRGKPIHIYSDCGSNFIGAANQLREILLWLRSSETKDKLVSYAADREIEWSFQAPKAPHFGGLWERAIKSAKGIFKRTMSKTSFTFEELTTVFSRIEAILNSRPLCPLYSDPDSFEYLTPGHFLVGAPLTSVPEQSLLDIQENRLSRWQLVKQRVQHYWKRWRCEYLHHLQQRRKWLKPQRNLEVGELVLLSDPTMEPAHWTLARIQQVHPGNDGVVRVVTLRTSTSTFRRPVIKVVPLLPITNSPSHSNPPPKE